MTFLLNDGMMSGIIFEMMTRIASEMMGGGAWKRKSD